MFLPELPEGTFGDGFVGRVEGSAVIIYATNTDGDLFCLEIARGQRDHEWKSVATPPAEGDIDMVFHPGSDAYYLTYRDREKGLHVFQMRDSFEVPEPALTSEADPRFFTSTDEGAALGLVFSSTGSDLSTVVVEEKP